MTVVMGTVVICKKIDSNVVDKMLLKEEEKIIMDNYFKVELPFLTKSQVEIIKNNFEAIYLASKSDNANSDNFENISIENNFITLHDAYTVMFENEEFLEYSYDFGKPVLKIKDL